MMRLADQNMEASLPDPAPWVCRDNTSSGGLSDGQLGGILGGVFAFVFLFMGWYVPWLWGCNELDTTDGEEADHLSYEEGD